MQKLRATVSGIITHPCFHNVWWKRNAISSILWSALTESGAALFTVESNGSSCGDVSLGLEFSLSFGAFSPIVSHIHCELLTLSTIAADDFGTNCGFSLSLSVLYFYGAGNQTEAAAKWFQPNGWRGHCILRLYQGLLSFMALMSSCAYSLVNWKNGYGYAV